ncbi:hypothetical protein FB451DRAFT_265676 [Mycena latifolia]|nr:hypothetical protein FB451DRAFT_265676 [Mycena latifolia]
MSRLTLVVLTLFVLTHAHAEPPLSEKPGAAASCPAPKFPSTYTYVSLPNVLVCSRAEYIYLWHVHRMAAEPAQGDARGGAVARDVQDLCVALSVWPRVELDPRDVLHLLVWFQTSSSSSRSSPRRSTRTHSP